MKFLIGRLRALFTRFAKYFTEMPKVVKRSFKQLYNGDEKVVQQWNKFFVIFCLFAIFLDTLFPFLQYVMQDNKCVTFNWPMMKALLVLRSTTDFIYLIHVVFQFRLAYVAPKSKVVGVGYFVKDPKKISLNCLVINFSVDFIAALPLPQIIILLIIRNYSFGGDNSNIRRDLLYAAIFFQNVLRLYRFMPLLAGQSSIGFIFKSAWSNFVFNLLAYVLAGHVVGSYWYLFGLQRVNQCLQDACDSSGNLYCNTFISCGRRSDIEKLNNLPTWDQWKKNLNATACFWQDGFVYGIYQNAVNLTTHKSLVKRYVYSLSWGFQQISTLAGNQVSSYVEWEALFVMAITGLGLLLFALLLGNMQNCLQALGRRRLEMSLRRRDIERWMKLENFPEELKKQVREAERSTWEATRGVEKRELMKNLPDDIQRYICDHISNSNKHGRVDQDCRTTIEEPPNHPSRGVDEGEVMKNLPNNIQRDTRDHKSKSAKKHGRVDQDCRITIEEPPKHPSGGVDEGEVMKNLPNDIQRDTRDHKFKSAKKHGRVDQDCRTTIEEPPNHPSRGVDEGEVMKNLPNDIQRDTRDHKSKSAKKHGRVDQDCRITIEEPPKHPSREVDEGEVMKNLPNDIQRDTRDHKSKSAKKHGRVDQDCRTTIKEPPNHPSRGVDEGEVMKNLPNDIQRDTRDHKSKSAKKHGRVDQDSRIQIQEALNHPSRGVDEGEVMKNLPNDIQRDTRDHKSKSAKKHGRVDQDCHITIEEPPNHPSRGVDEGEVIKNLPNNIQRDTRDHKSKSAKKHERGDIDSRNRPSSEGPSQGQRDPVTGKSRSWTFGIHHRRNAGPK